MKMFYFALFTLGFNLFLSLSVWLVGDYRAAVALFIAAMMSLNWAIAEYQITTLSKD